MKEQLSLGYLGIVGDRERWRAFAGDLYGMQAVETAGESALRLRLDDWSWRLSVEEGDKPGLDYIGIEIDSAASMDRIAGRLRDAGHDIAEDIEHAARRNVSRLMRTTSVDGLALELFVGGMVTAAPFSSPTGARFVSGGLGIGHVLLLVPDIEAALAYYTSLLGFRISDSVAVAPGIEAYFLHGGSRHHVVALASIPGLQGLDHLFVEVEDITTVGQAWDKVQAGAAPIVRAIGQHANDPAISFYARSPSGFAFEYGCHALGIGDETQWVRKRWDSIYLWGGQPGPEGHL